VCFIFSTGHFLPNALIPDAATRCGGLVAKTNSANHILVSQKRQQVGASVKVSGSEISFWLESRRGFHTARYGKRGYPTRTKRIH
jgi:hypothetical protein